MIFLTGDTHGEVFERIVKLRKQNKEDVKTQEQIYLIIMGDCGLVWDKDYTKTVKYIEKYISEHIPNLMILSVLGNHENYNLIYDLPKVNMFGNEYLKYRKVFISLRMDTIIQLKVKVLPYLVEHFLLIELIESLIRVIGYKKFHRMKWNVN